MGIESKYIKIDKGPTYLNGITTNTRSVQIWPNDHYLCGQFSTGLESLWDNGMIRMKEKKIHVMEREKRENSIEFWGYTITSIGFEELYSSFRNRITKIR